jgi:hypothetical protein
MEQERSVLRGWAICTSSHFPLSLLTLASHRHLSLTLHFHTPLLPHHVHGPPHRLLEQQSTFLIVHPHIYVKQKKPAWGDHLARLQVGSERGWGWGGRQWTAARGENCMGYVKRLHRGRQRGT